MYGPIATPEGTLDPGMCPPSSPIAPKVNTPPTYQPASNHTLNP